MPSTVSTCQSRQSSSLGAACRSLETPPDEPPRDVRISAIGVTHQLIQDGNHRSLPAATCWLQRPSDGSAANNLRREDSVSRRSSIVLPSIRSASVSLPEDGTSRVAEIIRRELCLMSFFSPFSRYFRCSHQRHAAVFLVRSARR